MKEWEYVGYTKKIALEDLVNSPQKGDYDGTFGFTEITLRCPECNIVTFVDVGIVYDYCPHCGARLDVADIQC